MINRRYFFPCLLSLLLAFPGLGQNSRPRELGIEIGILKPGSLNAITDVKGVRVGHVTLVKGDSVRTGVTAILPHGGNIFQQKVPAAIFIGNGFGKLAGYSQVEELGTIETPVILTNTLSIAAAIEGTAAYILAQEGNEQVRSVNVVAGETNDGYLNDIRGMHVSPAHVQQAIREAKEGSAVEEGNVGAGTGTVCFGFKGGIGTSSRVLPQALGGYTVGVLVQSNFGGVLEINGVPIAKELERYPYKEAIGSSDGSCMIVVATDAPVGDRNLKRMAQRALLGLAKTGGIASNGSGDYVIAFSNYPDNLVSYKSDTSVQQLSNLRNDEMTPLFLATIEATEEAIINSLFAARTLTGTQGHTIEALPLDKVMDLMRKYNKIVR
ncbi:MAG: P1 family peptidase [Cyclobacteriaceae bacterium]|nr:P1 family peptidase [Cyclobacteriaceae bacterium]